MGLDIFAIELEGNEKGQIVRLIGEFNEKTSMQFLKFMDNFLDNHRPDAVILDCQDLETCDSYAFSAMIKLYQNMRMLKKGLIIAWASKPVSVAMTENSSSGLIPSYEDLDRAKEIALYFLSKRANYDKRKLESLRETPAALMRDDRGESIFKNVSLSDESVQRVSSGVIKRPRTSETVKRYTTEDFTAWFKPEQSRRIRGQEIDVLILQSADNALGEAVTEILDGICTAYRLNYKKLLPYENRITWGQALETVNNARLVIIDFSIEPSKLDDLVLIMTIGSIARMQKTDDQLVLINSIEHMPLLWRDLPVIYYSDAPGNLDKFREKLDSILLPLSRK